MRIGDLIETGIWVTGDESPLMRSRYERDVIEAIDYFCEENMFIHGPVTFKEKHPEEDRVPSVPDHISGQRVRLLVAESLIVEHAIETSIGSFVAQLEASDLNRLRNIIRRHEALSDDECDEIIEELGPEAALDTLKSLH